VPTSAGSAHERTGAESKPDCEEWRAVVGFEGFEVSDWGRMRSYVRKGTGRRLNDRPRLLRPTVRKKTGYCVVSLATGDGKRKRKQKRVHMLVLEAFVGPRPAGMQGCHGDRDTQNNRLDNLRWDTPKGNAEDKHRHGTTVRGAAVNTAKLTADKVRDLRSRPPEQSNASLAREFGLSRPGTRNVRIGKAWASV
jgi:hypothetical protein